MRKFLAAILSLVCLICAGLAVACANPPEYYVLTFGAIDGVTLDFGEIKSGAQVKEGYTVRFEVVVDEDAVKGEPAVMVNGDRQLYPAKDTMPRLMYSFVMEEDSYVTVENVYSVSKNDIVFDKGEWRLTYTDLDGNELTEIKEVSSGETVEFKLDISVYYDKNSKYSVLANTQVAKYDAQRDVYSFVVRNNTTVSVSGLELEESFLSREDGGAGTEDDPYIIERPIDLYAMADRVNDDFYSGRYGLAFYKMTADIDMQGEQLFIIGDGTTSAAAFMGDFNGNGHTIKNYYMTGTIIEQSEFKQVFLPYIGLFGQAAATTYGPVNIYGLTLDNFEIKVDARTPKANSFVGGIMGLGIGVNIVNCKALNGTISVDADDGKYSQVGGIIGVMQSAYTESLSFNSYVSGCYSTVTVSGQSGYVYTGGGLVGWLLSADEKANACIINSAYSGVVEGVMNAGGIVGYVGAHASVKNCWSEGEVVAVNNIRQSTGFDEYLYAYAGGIAGLVEYNSVISRCFSLSETAASSTAGNDYDVSDGIAAKVSSADAEIVESFDGAVLNCTSDASKINSAYAKNTLGWSEDDWSFVGTYPAVNAKDGAKNISVTLKCGETSAAPLNLSSESYRTACEWYLNGLDEFKTSGGLRSYGYYFDKELTKKVPDAYVLTGDETLYYGLVDYNEVSGVYYLQKQTKGSGIYIELLPDGSLSYREGARRLTTSYIYDGTQLTLYGCPAFTETLEEYVLNENGDRVVDEDGNYVTQTSEYFSGAIASLLPDGRLSLINNLTYTTASPLVAVKEIDGFAYGGYYAGEDEYYFYTDGTGRMGNAQFTYTVSGSQITVNGNETLTGTVEGGKVKTLGGVNLTKYDPFKGTWEKSATTKAEYSFDGKGGWSYEFYEYINGEKHVLKTAQGAYVYDSEDGTIELDNGVVAAFDEKGMLRVTDTKEQTYYGESSFAGRWRYSFRPEAIEINFGGINRDGYGVATVRYETLGSDIEFTYHAIVVDGVEYVYLYDEEVVMGMLYYDADDYTLGGYIYSFKEDALVYYYLDGEKPVYVVAFCLYDEYYGEWLGEEWGKVSFNGFGSYNLAGISVKGETINVATSGIVSIKGESVAYRLQNATMDGSLTYKGVTYTISYDGVKDVVTVTPSNGQSFKLVRPDKLYNLTLLAPDGTAYNFDGGSGHESGGRVTAGDKTYSYKIADNGDITLYDGDSEAGNISFVGKNYVLTLGSESVTLTIENEFTGGWYVSGTLKTIQIGEIDASLTAEGSYLGEAVTFKYNLSSKTLSFELKGATYYVTAMFSSENGRELKISDRDDEHATSIYAVADGARDGYQGVYISENGRELMLDGFSGSAYTSGRAVFVGESEERYIYSVNEFGVIELKNGSVYKLLVEADKTAEGAYVKGDEAFVVVDPDRLYLLKPNDYFEQGFTFDGMGKVKTEEGNTYEYTVIPQTDDDIKNLICRMTFTDGENKEHDVQLDYSTRDYKLTFTDSLTGVTVYRKVVSGWGGNETEYTHKFVWAGYIEFSTTYYNKLGNLVTDTELCSYVIDGVNADETVYELTVTRQDGTTEKVTLDLEEDGGLLFT